MEILNERDTFIENRNDGMIKLFNRMFLGLLVTTIAAFVTYQSGLFLEISYGVLAIVELAVVLVFSFMFRKLSATMVTILYFAYALINGITMSVIFAVFEIETIFYAFLATALLFGGLALYGKTTQKDMTKLGTICTVGLIVGLVISLINLFVGNTMVDIVLDWIILLIFCGLTAYDMNKITKMENYPGIDVNKFYIYGAMELYLDFINMFIRILSIMGKRNN